MLTRDFSYRLPLELIAQCPLPVRSASRLLAVDTGTDTLTDRRFSDLPEILGPHDLLVFNDTRVLNARLYGRKDSGGKIEAMLERLLDERSGLFQLRASKPSREGTLIRFDGGFTAEVLGRAGEFFHLRFESELAGLLQQHGHAPLPPYIERGDDLTDAERYQTVYARVSGAVAAPTAGLHFDDALLDSLKTRGVQSAYVTLHVGAGTFSPVRVDDVSLHRMHGERYEVPEKTCAAIAACRGRGGRVVAVGTTSLRSLESAATSEGKLETTSGETRLFITPGYRFQVVDALITNFHLPESTLLMLVCAFGGHERVMNAYRHAVEKRYRFFSYGDAMFVEPCVSKR